MNSAAPQELDNYQTETSAAAVNIIDTETLITTSSTGPITQEEFLLQSSISPPIPAQPFQVPPLGTTILEKEEIHIFPDASYYWDASTMAPLNPTSAVST